MKPRKINFNHGLFDRCFALLAFFTFISPLFFAWLPIRNYNIKYALASNLWYNGSKHPQKSCFLLLWMTLNRKNTQCRGYRSRRSWKNDAGRFYVKAVTSFRENEGGNATDHHSRFQSLGKRERGSRFWLKIPLFNQGLRLNIIDTPGHADFSERSRKNFKHGRRSAANYRRPQKVQCPQTKFVLRKALSVGA